MQPSASQYFAARGMPQRPNPGAIRMSQPVLGSNQLSQGFSQPAYPTAARPPSAGPGTQLLRKGWSAGPVSQSMSQLSEEHLFVSNSQPRISPAMRPRSAPFEETSKGLASRVPTQGSTAAAAAAGKDVSALIREVLQELGHCNPANRGSMGSMSSSNGNMLAQQKQLDKIEKHLEDLQSSSTEQTHKFDRLAEAVAQLASTTQEAVRQKPAVMEQGCQTDRLPQAATAAAPRPTTSHPQVVAEPTSRSRSGFGLTYPPASSTRQPLQLTTTGRTSSAAAFTTTAVKTVETLLHNTAWRQSKSSLSGKSIAAPPAAQKVLGAAQHSSAHEAEKPQQLRAPAVAGHKRYADMDTSPSTSATDIFGAAYEDDQEHGSKEMEAAAPLLIDEEDLARQIRKKMNRHRSLRMKRARLAA